MAENESLDIDSRYGRRWKIVVHSAMSGKSAHEVGRDFKKAFHAGLKKAVKQLEKCGLTIHDLFAARHQPETLRKLLRQCMGHSYAQSLVDSIRAMPTASDDSIAISWLYAVRDKIADQISLAITGTEHFPNCSDTMRLFEQIEHQNERDLIRVAEKVLINPRDVPNALPDRQKKLLTPTESILTMSLLQRSTS